MSFISSFLDLLFPPKCVFCGRVIGRDEDGVCSKCNESLPFAPDNGRQTGEFYDYCVSPLYYNGLVRKSMLRFKFKGASAYAEIYGKLLAECVSRDEEISCDVISWVPLSSERLRSRGYDQSMLIAMSAALRLDGVAVETLRKPRNVRAQSEIPGAGERAANISGAYEAADPELFAGKCVLLIDDIITTGSTLTECAKVLLSAGAGKVICATLARGQ